MKIVDLIFDKVLYAKVISANDSCQGIHFLSSPDDNLQIGYMGHPAGHEILPHIHLPIQRKITGTQEILFIRKGVLQVIFFNDAHIRVGEITLREGDVIILLNGGHGFKVLEDVEMVEVKQGPFVEGHDKVRFKEVKRTE